MRSKTSINSKASDRKDPTDLAKKQPKKHLQTPTKTKICTLYRNYSQSEIIRILKEEDNITIGQPAISRIVRQEDYRRVGNSDKKPET